jgi:type II secretory pathway pseudopilin PulG
MGARACQFGFTYLAALFAIAFMGIGLAAIGVVWHTAQQREKERELLFVGNQFRKAIETYYQQTPGVGKRYPRNLETLLQDDRFPVARRHLRQVYADPLSGKADWGTVPAPDGGIMGVYSFSEKVPVKSGNFLDVDKDFEGKEKYADWKFIYMPPSAYKLNNAS